MGIYLNPGNENYKRMSSQGMYVDKTMMISVTNRHLNSDQSYICMSRPRRFGKTYAGNMLCAYYTRGSDTKELFSRFKIAGDPDFEKYINQFNVIKIDMNSDYQNSIPKERVLQRLTKEIKKEMAAAFPMVEFEEYDSLAQSILRVYAATGETFI